jgi:hypothetical protein
MPNPMELPFDSTSLAPRQLKLLATGFCGTYLTETTLPFNGLSTMEGLQYH